MKPRKLLHLALSLTLILVALSSPVLTLASEATRAPFQEPPEPPPPSSSTGAAPANATKAPPATLPGQQDPHPELPTPASRPSLSPTTATGPAQSLSARSNVQRTPRVGGSVSASHFDGDLRQLPALQRASGEPTVVPLYLLPGTSSGFEFETEAAGTEQETIPPFNDASLRWVDVPSTTQNWEGMNNLDGVLPPDTVGDVGMTYYIQMTNFDNVAIYTKATGALTAGPFNLGTLWSGGDPCNTSGRGDVIVLYDRFADRWMLSQFAITGGNYYECIAVSSTSGDPVTGGWYAYTFDVTNDGPLGDNWFNDYPKFGIWSDAYYMTANQFGDAGGFVGGAWAFERGHLLNFTTPVSYTYFTVDTEGGLLPSDLDGANSPPSNSPNYLVSMQDDAGGVPFDQLRVYEFDYYPGNPISSTLSGPWLLATEPFEADICDAVRGRCIPQPDTDVDLESLSDRLMFRLAYRNFGDYEAMVVNHTVRVDPQDGFELDPSGVRWYELRKAGVNDDWFIYQQDTFAPDDDYRWMGSVAMDGEGNIGIGYSISNEDLYPSIRYTGRKAEDPRNTTPRREEEIIAGSGSQTHFQARWGDYSAMSVDPGDDCTFWYTQEYVQTTGTASWQTRIASFKFPSCGAAQRIHGTVYDADTLHGLPWVAYGTEVIAQPAPTGTLDTYLPGVGGIYGGSIVSGTYDVTARAYGYEPLTIGGVDIDDGDDVQLDFSLQKADEWTVEGTVSDNQTGYPVHARITVNGDPFDPPAPADRTWSDPLTGYYSLTLSSHVTYTFQVDAVGYDSATRTVGPLTTDATEDFALTPDLVACKAPGYEPVELFYDGFESGGLGTDWAIDTTNDGRVTVSGMYPYAGTYGVLLDDAVDDGVSSRAAITLTQDLSTQSNVALDFWWREFGDENHAEDGVFISDDYGASWYPVLSFNDGPDFYRNDVIDIAGAAADHGLTLNDHFGIKFQFYDNFSIPSDGYAVDEVWLYGCQAETGAILQPARIETGGCPCTPQVHELTFINHTGLDDTINLTYTASPSVTVMELPDSLGQVPDGGVRPFEAVVKIDSDALSGTTVYVTVTASLESDPAISTTAVIEKLAFPGWESVANSAPLWAGTAYPVDGCTARNADGDWVTYIISDTTTSLMPDFVGYHYASDTWFDPGATNVPTGRWAPDWAYDPEYNVCYLTGGASSPGTGTYAEAYRFDPDSNDFTQLPDFSTVRDFHDSWVGNIDGTKYLCIGGGNSGDVGISSTQCYNLDTTPGSWEPENSVMGGYPTDIWGAADGLLHRAGGDQFWVVAGEQSGVISDTAHYFDDADNSWHVAGNTGQPRRRLEGDFKHGDFYQLGGVTSGFNHTPTTVRGRWNGSAWEWEQLADMPNSRMDPVVGVTPLHGPEVPETIWSLDGYGDGNAGYIDYLIQCPDCDCRLELDKTGPEWVYQGDVGGYLITLANAGQCTASASLTDTIPSGAAYAGGLSCSDGTCQYDSGDDAVYWDGQVAPYSAVTLAFDVTATAPISTWVVNTARISPTNAILHIYTQDTVDSVQLAMDELGYTYDTFAGFDWTGIDFDPYDVVIVGLDGGWIAQASIQKLRADVIDRGKRLILLGGSNWESFALGVDQYLVDHDTTNRIWTVSDPPHMTLFDPGHPLAQGLASTYNFSNTYAAYYQTRVTDSNIEPIAVNGDGYVNYFRKDYASSDLVWFTNSPYDDYWSDPDDFAVLKQVVANALAYAESSHTFHVNRPPDIAWDKDVYINGTWVGEPEAGPFSVVPSDTVAIVERLTYTGTLPLFATLTEAWSGYPLSFQEESHTNGAVACGSESCDWGITLLPGASERLVKTFHVTDTGTLSITEWLESDETAPYPRTVVLEQPHLGKDGPGAAYTGEVIPYTIVFETRPGILGPAVLSDALPPGLAFADALTATYGSAWYSSTANAVYWTNQSVTGTQAFQKLRAPQARAAFKPMDASSAGQSIPDLPANLSLSLSPVSPDGGRRSTAPRAPSSPGATLWDQPLSITNTNAYANQDFETSLDAFDIYIADDFTNTVNWNLDTIFVPANLWSSGTSLTNALTLNWQIYADNSGVPDGDPSGDGISPSWSLSLPPTHTQVTLGTGSGGYTSNVTLTLTTPASLPPGAWWLVFYPRMDAATGGQYGRQVSETANGYEAQVVNPGGGFGFPTQWGSARDAWGLSQQEFAFRLEGETAPSVVTVTFNVTVTAPPGDSVVNVAELNYHDFILSAEDTLGVLRPQPAWEKQVWVDGAGPFPASQGAFAVDAGDLVTIADRVWITAATEIGYLALTETWDPSLTLSGHDSSTGSVLTDTGVLTWNVTDAPFRTWMALTKTFEVETGDWLVDRVTETLEVADADPQPDPVYLEFWHTGVCQPVVITDVVVTVDQCAADFGPTYGGTPPIGWAWVFQNGTPPNSSATSPSGIVFGSSGTYDYMATATNCGGAQDVYSDTVTVSCPDCEPLTGVDFVWSPASPVTSDTVTFTATVTPPAATGPVQYEWRFGDGGTALGNPVYHNYPVSNTYTAWVTARNGCSLEAISHTLTVTGPTFVPSYGVELTPPADSDAGAPGETVTYTLTVRNTGDVADTFDLSYASSNGWAVDFAPASVNLLPDGTAQTVASVDIPSSASGGVEEVTTATATSQGNPAVDDSSTLTTTVLSYGVELTPPTANDAGAPGETVTYTLTIRNTGEVTDTFDLSYTSSNGWAVDFAPASVNLSPDGTAQTVASVDIPSSANDGVEEVTTATATSQGNPAVDDSSTLTTTVVVPCVDVAGADWSFTPSAPQVGGVITFTGSVTAGDLPITYTWRFGDGGSGTGQTITHTYTASDTYSVIMTATNNCPSRDTATGSVTVTEAAGPPKLYLPLVLKSYSSTR